MNILPKETINDPRSLDAIFVEMHKAYDYEKTPMTEDQTRWTMSIMLADDAAIDKMYEDFSGVLEFAALFSRSSSLFPIKYEKRLLIWLGVMTHDFGVGGVLLVAYYVQWFAYRRLTFEAAARGEENKTASITLSFICENCFPFGVFSKETVHKFWDKQKVAARPDNLIDQAGAQGSFMKPMQNESPAT